MSSPGRLLADQPLVVSGGSRGICLAITISPRYAGGPKPIIDIDR